MIFVLALSVVALSYLMRHQIERFIIWLIVREYDKDE